MSRGGRKDSYCPCSPGEMLVCWAQGSPHLMPESGHARPVSSCLPEIDRKLSPAINPTRSLRDCRGFSVLLPWPRFPRGPF